MSAEPIGVLGFGEVGSTFSDTLAANGGQVLVYDALLEEEGGGELLRSRIRRAGIELASQEEMLARSDTILSVVTTQVAEEVAGQAAGQLRASQVFVDLNSTSPGVKKRIGETIEASGAQFVEGAVLGAVGATGAKTRILITGEVGQEVAQRLSALGLNAEFYSTEIGQASTFKMLRSVFTKGAEALMLELMLAARRAGIEGGLWQDLTAFMSENAFDRVVANWIRSHAVASERRYYEMRQVVETVKEVGIEPLMTEAALAFFKRSQSFDLAASFHEKPDDHLRVVDFMLERLADAQEEEA